MRIVILPISVVDCTADPHPVQYLSLDEALEDVLTVCESSLVQAISYVALTLRRGEEEEYFESDFYSTSDFGGERKPLSRMWEEKHKLRGLYFAFDAEVESSHHLPPGLTGVREAIKVIRRRSFDLSSLSLSIGVVWAFAGEHSCADRISLDWAKGECEVDYSNQDWWIELPGYEKHCHDLSKLIGKEIEVSEKIHEVSLEP